MRFRRAAIVAGLALAVIVAAGWIAVPYFARDLTARGVPVHVLLTPLITHAEVDKASTLRRSGG